jgi:hypothetical protein
VVTWRIVRSRRTTTVARLAIRVGESDQPDEYGVGEPDGTSENIRLRPLVVDEAERADRREDDDVRDEDKPQPE